MLKRGHNKILDNESFRLLPLLDKLGRRKLPGLDIRHGLPSVSGGAIIFQDF
jgi:hypothetical protein